MRVALLTVGTRGDVQPFVALGRALAARGHEVIVGAPDDFEDGVRGHGLGFRGMGVDMQAFLESPEARRVMSGSWLGLRKLWREMVVTLFRRILDATWDVGRDADVLVYHPKAQGTPDVAEATGAAALCALPIPMVPTGDFPAIVFPGHYGRFVNRLTYKLFDLSRWPYRRILDDWRRTSLGLGPGPGIAPLGTVAGALAPRLCAVSGAVVPRPKDWDPGAYMTGYWFLDEGGNDNLDPELEAFLTAGEPPVYVGFGSMATRDPARLTRAVVDGLTRARVRAVLATGWDGLARIDVPESIHVVPGAPHELLFPRCRAVVHHGGAGTTAAGLRAGRPTLVCPFSVDQPFWGRRVHAAGAGPRPLRVRRLDGRTFGDRVRALVETEPYRARAGAIGQAIAQEDGVGRAVALVEGAAPGVRSTDASRTPR